MAIMNDGFQEGMGSHQVRLIRTSGLFKDEWYLSEYPDVAGLGMDPLEHYLRVGAKLLRNPGPGFNTRHYVTMNPDVAAAGVNPLVHYISHGRRERRSPLPGIDVTSDIDTAIDIVVPVFNALEDVKACLGSVRDRRDGFRVNVVVVNDGSDGKTSSWLREFCQSTNGFKLLEHDRNRGYTHAVNTGLRASASPYVITLNSDAIVSEGWLKGMLRCMMSAPEVGIVGPLSNAASWQNVPELYDKQGKFAVNGLPSGLSPDDMARLVACVSRREYPRTNFVNGFCFMVRREVINQIGYMDDQAFPVGYGEENDFCIRAHDAGFALAIADDSYVFHSKSRSFGHEQRQELSRQGSAALRKKHGSEKFEKLVREVKKTDRMDTVRRRIREAVDRQCGEAVRWVGREFSVLYLLPVEGGGGGAHSVVQEAMDLRRIGIFAKVAVPAKALEHFVDDYRDIPDSASTFIDFDGESIVALAAEYDVVVATIYSSMPLLKKAREAFPHILPAYYIQDYEPMFFAEGSSSWKRARESYDQIGHAVLFGKTHWVLERVSSQHDVCVHKVEPSIDHDVYRPRPRVSDGKVHIAAMIRPSTRRRGAGRTMQLFSMLAHEYADKLVFHIFGCEPGDADFLALTRDFDFQHHGRLRRQEVGAVLSQCDLFVDLSDYQAFGRTALEAMACGCTAVVPIRGGADEYAVNRQNALVVDSVDVDECFRRIGELVLDPDHLSAMKQAALRTASRYSTRRAATSTIDLFAVELARHRRLFPAPAGRTVRSTEAPPVLRIAGDEGVRSSQPADQVQSDDLAVVRRYEDMSGASIVLHPPPSFESADYHVARSPASSVLVTPLRVQPDIRLSRAPDVGVHLHLYHRDLLDEFIGYLSNIPFRFSLYVSVIDPAIVDAVDTTVRARLPKATVLVRCLENRGRDIASFVSGFASELRQHEYIAHIHTKRSVHNAAKSDWRRQLLTYLLGSRSIVASIFRRLETSRNVGMVFPVFHHSLQRQISWGTNFEACEGLASRIGINIDRECMSLFPAGSMFWARSDALKPLFHAGLTYSDFPDEAGQVDGTIAHAVERLFGEVVTNQGYDLLQTRCDRPYTLVDYHPHQWPYAEPADVVQRVAAYRKKKKRKNRIAVYTALSGGYDSAVIHEVLDPDIDYIMFTDSHINDRGFWMVKPMDWFHPEPVRMARRIKTNPHIYLKDYDWAIWIDANVIIRGDVKKFLEGVKKEGAAPIAGIPHPQRRCAYLEAKAVVAGGRDKSGRADKQMRAYDEDGFPTNAGLIETNLMAINLRNPQTPRVMSEWWSQIVQHSHRDQLSLNYALWKTSAEWIPLMTEKRSLRDSGEFAYLGHGRNSGYIASTVPEGAKTIDPYQMPEDASLMPASVSTTGVDIVVCVHNALEEVRQCLDSVVSAMREVDRLIVVDDASSSPTADFLREFCAIHGAQLLRNDPPAIGYCRSANIGMAACKQEFFLLLNSDTVLIRAALEEMLAVALRYQYAGVVGPLSNAASTQSIPDVKGTAVQTAINDYPAGQTIESMNALCQQWSHPALSPSVPLVHGFCQLIRYSVYQEIGGFDADAFPEGYGEENDFCLRAANAGFDLRIATRAYVYHVKSASYTDDERRKELMAAGGRKLREKHGEDRLKQAITMMEAHPLLEKVRAHARELVRTTQ